MNSLIACLFGLFSIFPQSVFSAIVTSYNPNNNIIFLTDFSNLWLPRSGNLGLKGFALNTIDSITVGSPETQVSILFNSADSLALFIPLPARSPVMRLKFYRNGGSSLSAPFYYCLGAPLSPIIEGSPVRVGCSNSTVSLVTNINDYPLLWNNGSIANTLVVNASGVYSARLNYTEVCGIGSPRFGNLVRVGINEVPRPVVRQRPDGFVEVTGVDTLAGPEFFWFLNDTLRASTLTRFYFNDAWNGSLRVDILYNGGCRASSEPALVTPSKRRLSAYLKFFPSPAFDVLSIEKSEALSDVLKVSLLSLEGKRLMDFSLVNFLTEINLHSLAPGVYLLRFEDAKGSVFVDKLIKY